MLKDDLLKIATETVDSDDEILRLMFNRSLNEITLNLENISDKDLIPLIQRIDNTWNLVSSKTGNWINENAFSLCLRQMSNFKLLIENLERDYGPIYKNKKS